MRPEEPAYNDFADELKTKVGDTIPFNAFDKMFIIMYFEKLINPLTKLDIDFFWLDYKKDIKSNPAIAINSPKLPKKLPKVLTKNEIEKWFKNISNVVNINYNFCSYINLNIR